jgi:hypothetical protein
MTGHEIMLLTRFSAGRTTSNQVPNTSKSTLLNDLKSIETQVIIKPLLQGKRATKKQSKSSITSIDLSSLLP